MTIGLKSWGEAGIACFYLVGAILLALYWQTLSKKLALQPALLGSPALCAGYSGLPDHWGSSPLAGMTYIAGGEFTLGTSLGYAEEREATLSKVSGFWIDKTEVTVAQFSDFVTATGYITEAEREGGGVVFNIPSSEELNQRAYAWWSYVKGADWRHPLGVQSTAAANQPVTLVTLNDALAYAQWLGRDLPTETEWEYAAKARHQDADLEKEPRDTQGKPSANFWQGSFPISNSAEDGYTGLAPVGCYAANDFQLYDMVGNAWEQTKDIYSASHQPNSTEFSKVDLQRADRPMVVKGGSHLCGRDFCVRYRPSAREAHEANLAISHIGFRTVRRNANFQLNPEFSAW